MADSPQLSTAVPGLMAGIELRADKLSWLFLLLLLLIIILIVIMCVWSERRWPSQTEIIVIIAIIAIIGIIIILVRKRSESTSGRVDSNICLTA